MKRICILVAFSYVFISIHANDSDFTQTVRGSVTDAITGYPLVGATVVILNSDPLVGTVTDPEGFFELNSVPVGRQSVEISYVGYLPSRIDNLLLTSAKEMVINIKLEESALEVDEVVVSAKKRKDATINEMAMVSSRTFSVEETERFAGSLGDPARMVANYAGVMTQNDSRNDIIIRGNSPSGVLWRLEGIEIANPNHFGALGTTGGPVSMVNNNLLTNSDFLTGAFPAEYGNALAGAFDLNIRSGNDETTEFTGQVGFNGFELGAEGPFFRTKNGVNPSYLINYRYSTLAVVSKLGLDMGTGSAVPEYQDLTFLVDVPATRAGRFKLFGLWGLSNILLIDSVDNAYNQAGGSTHFGSDLAVLGMTHTYFLTEKIRMKTTASYQQTSAITEVDSVNFKEEIYIPYYRSLQGENKLSFSTQFRHKINAKNNYSLGMVYDRYTTLYHDSAYIYDQDEFRILTDTDGDLAMLRGYAQWQHKFNDQLTAYAGVHSQYLDLTEELAVEPRMSLRWQLSPKSSLDLGFGMHSQMQPKAVYYQQDYDPDTHTYSLTNEDVEFTKSIHYVLGYNYLFAPDFRVKMEAYYQDLYRVPVAESFPEYSMLNSGDFFGIFSSGNLVNEGTGKNYGLELTVEKFLSKNYYLLFTGSVFDSKYTGYDGIERNTAYNGNYVFNCLAGYEKKLSDKMMLTFDVKGVYAGGKRYVPYDWEQSQIEQIEVYDWDHAYEERYADYFRVDLRIGFKLNGKRMSQEWGLDLQNITNHLNIFSQGYDVATGETTPVPQQGFIPMMLYRINF
ncbi:MAG: TonB-dependent receptor [Bacteroidales bacterium]|nr:TonB-dependent receptor [Bacteroidales bacterium]